MSAKRRASPSCHTVGRKLPGIGMLVAAATLLENELK
jgi:hypothetical protein